MVNRKELYSRFKGEVFKVTVNGKEYIFRYPSVGEYVYYSTLVRINLRAASNYLVSACIISPEDLDFNDMRLEQLANIILDNYLLSDPSRLEENVEKLKSEFSNGYPYELILLKISQVFGIPYTETLNFTDKDFVKYTALLSYMESGDIKEKELKGEVPRQSPVQPNISIKGASKDNKKIASYDELPRGVLEAVKTFKKKRYYLDLINWYISRIENVKRNTS